MKRLASALFFCVSLYGQQTCPSGSACRNVLLSWTASTSASLSGFQGYNVFRSESGGAPVQINSSVVTAVSYIDSAAVIGNTYTYTLIAVAAACTSTTAATAICGQSVPSAPASTTVPLQPAVTTTVIITVP